LMTFKSGFANENSAVRWERAPGPLREAAGFTYQEFSNLEKPLALKADPFHVGVEENKVGTWAEFLQLTSAKALATYDHPFFGRWPAITRNNFGSGTLTYEGTMLSDKLQRALVLDTLRDAGLSGSEPSLPANVRLKSGTNGVGKKIHYYLNYSSTPASVRYSFGAGRDLLTGKASAPNGTLQLGPWDLAIMEEGK
jgi:beta-galactosidase